MSPDKKSQQQVLLTLAEVNNKCKDCPSEETLAAYIDDIVSTGLKREITAHLTQCTHCRELWIEVSSVIENSELECSETIIDKPQYSFLHSSPQLLIRKATRTFPIALTVVILVVFLFAGTPTMDERLDAQHAWINKYIDAQFDFRTNVNPSSFPLPWENTSLAFSHIPPNNAQKAIGAGLWQSRQDFISTHISEEKNPYSSNDDCCWSNTLWKDYYLLGRWLGLMWWQTQLLKQGEMMESTIPIDTQWVNHRDILQQFRKKFSNMQNHDYRENILSELERMEPKLSHPVKVAPLHKYISHAIHRLGPTVL